MVSRWQLLRPGSEIICRTFERPDIFFATKTSNKHLWIQKMMMSCSSADFYPLFPTCQVKVSRFYHSCILLRPRVSDFGGHCRTSAASARCQGAAGSQLRAPDLNGHRRTPTASSSGRRDLQISSNTAGPQPRSQWALLDLNHERQMSGGAAGLQPRVPDHLNCELQIAV